ncbi:MAG: nucleotidyltransferase substrate binding protein [Gammaproteobacteria bacterium]|nr:nucleotidyltransferase substrate binding protein [Gammaproteobacteria bacterium]
MNQELGIADSPNSPKPTFRLAHENGLLVSPPETWFEYVEARIGTSHDHDGEKAKSCLELMSNFIDDAIGLYQTMIGETWE